MSLNQKATVTLWWLVGSQVRFQHEEYKTTWQRNIQFKGFKSFRSVPNGIETRSIGLLPNPMAFKAHVDSSTEELEERGSLGSNGSQDMIIRKKTTWKIVRP
jgi:hypothetical protein